eukprot:SAG11_NODE_6351_length_1330_cov_3.295695_1_plen_156_part_00
MAEELLEVPLGAAAGERLTLRTADGQTISLTVPDVPGRPSGAAPPQPPPTAWERALQLKEEGNELYRAGQPALAAKAYTQALRTAAEGAADAAAEEALGLEHALWNNLAACHLAAKSWGESTAPSTAIPALPAQPTLDTAPQRTHPLRLSAAAAA